MLNQLKARYERYEQEARQARKKASAFDGLFGMGADPRRHPCHESFYEDVARWVQEFLEAGPSVPEVSDAVEWILMAADSRRGTDVYWYMYAAQGLAEPLIGRMAPERCAQLLRWYDKAYPKCERMPVQASVYKLLRKCVKAKK